MLRQLGTIKVVFFIAMLLLSVSTLAHVIFVKENQTFYTVATSVSHIGLVLFGSACTRSYIASQNHTNK